MWDSIFSQEIHNSILSLPPYLFVDEFAPRNLCLPELKCPLWFFISALSKNVTRCTLWSQDIRFKGFKTSVPHGRFHKHARENFTGRLFPRSEQSLLCRSNFEWLPSKCWVSQPENCPKLCAMLVEVRDFFCGACLVFSAEVFGGVRSVKPLGSVRRVGKELFGVITVRERCF
jgi:hypothetical protein